MKIIIAGGERLFQDGMVAIFLQTRDIVCVGTARNAKSLLIIAEKCRPDIILLDPSISGKDSVELVREIKSTYPNTAILVITDPQRHRLTIRSFMQADADGLISRETPKEEMLNAIRLISTGHTVLSSDGRGALVGSDYISNGERHHYNNKDVALHDREIEVLTYVSKGMTNKAIGIELSLSQHTIASHMSHIFSKLGTRSRTKAVMLAQQLGFI